MACIKGVSRSASVAFAPDSPYLAAGTMAGAVDLSFSSSANLEIFKLDFQSDDRDLPVVAECPSSDRFNRLSWGKTGSATEEFSLGLIAGGLVDGSINIWNPLTLIHSDDVDGALVRRLQKHSGPVRGLEFNINSPNLLASGAEEGELYIWDLSNPADPTHYPPLKSVGSGAHGEVSFLSWNHKVQHILASTSYNGMTVVWDLRRQKPVISFSDPNRRRCSVLQWNPDLAIELLVASDDDSSPALRLWDVRNTMSPLKEFVGHSKGVIAMSWCPNDSSFLLTCAKDNRSICWDTITAEMVCELPASTNWNFDIHWYPKIPGVISASSFDGKIGIYNLEACSRLTSGEFTGALCSTGSLVHLRAPKWLKRPVGASFGFGGRLVSFHSSSSTAGASSGTSEVHVHNLDAELSLGSRSAEFENAIQKGERALLWVLCDKKSQESESEDERETWGFLKVMIEDEGTDRTKLLIHLGFSVHTEGNENVHGENGKEITHNLGYEEMNTNKTGLVEDGEVSLYPTDNGEEFFNNLPSPKADPSVLPGSDGFIAEDGEIPNGEEAQQGLEGHGQGSVSSFDEAIQRALVIGDYKGAVSRCVSADRMADALVISHVGGTALWESTRDQYLKKSNSSYLKVVSAMVNNDLMSLVNARPLHSWKETLALLCTFAQKEEWTRLCDTLASRLMTAGNTLAATLCYICAGNIDKTVEIWSRNLKYEHEGKTYVELLQGLMEKTIILALATGQKQFSTSLSKLVEKYAELLAGQGLLTTAMVYLKLLGSEGPSHELAILRDRIALFVQETEAPQISPSDNTQLQTKPIYGADQSGFSVVGGSQHYYQDNMQLQQHQSVSSSPYGESYQQSFSASFGGGRGGYQHMQPKQQFQEYPTSSFQPATFPQVFLPSQPSQVPQANFAPPPVTTQTPVGSFVPSTPYAQYQQPALSSQPYPGASNPAYQAGPLGSASLGAGPSQMGSLPGHRLPQVVAPTPTPHSFMPVTNPGFAPRLGMGLMQPPSPTQSAQVQSVVAPPAPPPMVQTADTSNVPAELRPVITTLTRLYNEISEALGGSRANPAKKREMEDNSRKIGSLFAKLNSGDISPNAASKLSQLCQALDSGDFAGALHIQVLLTTSDWDECNFWLAALKRMIKTRQNVR
ncbi:protein transport protein SEC31 homolog B-like isoform X2 [Magnolia sinica]|uniref:protein transport protein SEC31 homolog B-like isoform X2 n=1 Tax=Magnolia sinica TaxID=86752 RepID=UPI00265A4944|nr:protein transport protein SEC31 homolog B-like isoform X2 [Magnolia sinica]